MPADSLVDMARRACTRYSARITDIGDLDYELIRTVLLKIASPEKLVSLRQASVWRSLMLTHPSSINWNKPRPRS